MKNLDTGALSYTQARHFRDLGYYRLPGIYSADETAEMREFVAGEAAKTESDRARRLGGPVLKMRGLYGRNPTLVHRLITKPALVGALKSLLGPNVVFLTNRHNHATINDQQGSPGEGLHRDILQPTRGIIAAAIYLEDANVENGATRIIPGSHNLPYVGVPEETGGGVWMAEHEEYAGMEDQAVPVPMPEGGALLFSGLVFHGAGANLSGNSRMSLTLAYRAADELDANPDPIRQIVVAGEQTYRGNEHFLPGTY